MGVLPNILASIFRHSGGFTIEVKTDNAAPFGSVNVTANDQFRYALLPTVGGYSFRIKWGDGSYDDVTCGVGVAPVVVNSSPVPGSSTSVGTYVPTYLFAAVPFLLHTYPAAGTYNVVVTPNAPGGLPAPICITDPRQTADRGSDALKVTKLKRWGTNQWQRFTNAFQGCSNLIITATDSASANFSACTHFGSAFERTAITSFPSFSLPAATNLNFMFFQAYLLAVAPVLVIPAGVPMWSTFRECTSLVNFPAMNLSGVTRLDDVCNGCSALVSGFVGPASASTTFARSFDGCPLLKSSFAALVPTAMTGAADFADDSDLNNPNTAANQTNYNALLVAWTGWAAGAPGAAGLALQPNVVIDFGVLTKVGSADGVAARAWLIATKGWTITDGGVSFVGPLDGLSQMPQGAYALQRLFTAYNGPLVRLIRSTDNAELDWSALVTGELDTAAILTWASTGYVNIIRMYSQVGGDSLVQNVALIRPILVLPVGSLQVVNGNPAAIYNWSGFESRLDLENPIDATNFQTMGVCVNFPTAASRILSLTDDDSQDDYNSPLRMVFYGESYPSTRKTGSYYDGSNVAVNPTVNMNNNPFAFRVEKAVNGMNQNVNGDTQVGQGRDFSGLANPIFISCGCGKQGAGTGLDGYFPTFLFWTDAVYANLPPITDYANVFRPYAQARFGTP